VLGHELDRAVPEARVTAVHLGPPVRRGAGVIVGIIDSGINYQHPAFRRATGSTRILAIWDQRLVPQAGESSPAGFTFGVEYTSAQINAALATPTPLSLVRHKDSQIPGDGFHGTHVAGIAAGNGRPFPAGQAQGTFVGVAPDADIVVVANTRGRAQNERGLGDSADTLDAIQYILNVAASLGRPVAINQSQGDNVGPHDGTSLLEVGMANLMVGSGRALVKSAGNEGELNRHAQGTLTAGASQNVPMSVPGGIPGVTQVVVDLWYPGPDRISVSLTPPNGTASTVVPPGSSVTLNLSNGNSAFVDSDLNDPGNHDNRIFVVLQPGSDTAVEAGDWAFTLTGTSITNGKWHAWIQRNSFSQFGAPFVNRASTISVPGTSLGVITVGSYVSNGANTGSTNGDLSTFSSRGPTRDGRRAPTLAAPGEELTAPQPQSAAGFFGPMQGTSMASPMVTGTVALMLELQPTATTAQIRQCLESTARLDGDTGPAAGNDWGAGKLDAQAACACITSP
jgi:subtilisin family serine protease